MTIIWGGSSNIPRFPRLSKKFEHGYLPSRDNIFLYPTNLPSLENIEVYRNCMSKEEARETSLAFKMTPFGRFGLIKIDVSYNRNSFWVVSIKHNALAVRCKHILSQSLVWSLKHKSLAVGETHIYWQEFLDYANSLDELTPRCMALLKKISLIEHPDFIEIVKDAVMIRMLKPVAPIKEW